MKACHGRVLCLALMAGVFAGCDEDTVSPPNFNPTPYASPTAPESLITNLQRSYHRHEIKEYAKLLAPEFIFNFQPQDANEIGTPSWTRDQDSTGTRALLTTPEVSDIRLDLIYGQKDPTLDTTPPVDTLKIRIITTDLQVDQTDGTTWVVQDQQDFFFRQGLTTSGEDPTHWFIYRWDDLPTLTAPRFEVAGTTWGRMKNRYKPSLNSTVLSQSENFTWGRLKTLYTN